MADELDPNATAATAGDPGGPGAEPDPGTQGGEAAGQPTVAELQAQLAEMARQNELLLKVATHNGGRPAAEAPVNSPTAPDPRAESAIREEERRARSHRAELQRLADGGDVAASAALRLDDQRTTDLERMGNALRLVYGELQELKADTEVPEAERADWKAWYKDHKGDYNSMAAARLGFAGHKAIEAAKAPKPAAPANGGGPARPAAPVRPAPARQRVDQSFSTRPVGAAEVRKSAQQVRGEDFDNQIAALQASNDPGDRAEARRLQGLVNSGELETID